MHFLSIQTHYNAQSRVREKTDNWVGTGVGVMPLFRYISLLHVVLMYSMCIMCVSCALFSFVCIPFGCQSQKTDIFISFSTQQSEKEGEIECYQSQPYPLSQPVHCSLILIIINVKVSHSTFSLLLIYHITHTTQHIESEC